MKTKHLMCALALFCVPAIAVAGMIRSSKVLPIVDVQSGYLLGGTRDKNWIKPQATAAQIKGGEKYRLLEPKRVSGMAIGSKARTNEAPCEKTFFVDIKPRKSVLAIGGKWKTQPRATQILGNNSPVYRKIVGDILRKNRLQPNVKITQIWRVDLEGDGQNEVLISATNHKGYETPGSISSRSLKNEYSMTLLRKVVGGKVVTQMLEEEYYPKNKDFNAPNVFTLAGVWDLNGDGRLEIVTFGRYYEGNWTTIYEMRGSKATKVLEEGCGA